MASKTLIQPRPHAHQHIHPAQRPGSINLAIGSTDTLRAHRGERASPAARTREKVSPFRSPFTRAPPLPSPPEGKHLRTWLCIIFIHTPAAGSVRTSSLVLRSALVPICFLSDRAIGTDRRVLAVVVKRLPANRWSISIPAWPASRTPDLCHPLLAGCATSHVPFAEECPHRQYFSTSIVFLVLPNQKYFYLHYRYCRTGWPRADDRCQSL